jgi:putative hydrolase
MAGFGFTPNDPDDSNENQNRENLEAMMRQMQEQIKAQFDQLGISSGLAGLGIPGFGAADGKVEVLPLATVRDIAKKFAVAQGSQPLGTKDLTAINNACEIADIWLNEATLFPATSSSLPRATSRLDWIDATLPGWQATMEPLAAGLAAAISRLLDDAMSGDATNGDATNGDGGAQESPIPIGAIAGLLKSFIGSMIATQLGQAIGAISASAVGAHDAGLPILEPARPLLIPENIDLWGADTEIAKTEVYLFHALREGAIARLFEHNPWIVSYIRSAIVEYGTGIKIDLEAIQRQAEEAMSNGANEISIALDAGIFTPEETPAQRAALSKLETVLALVDGWADDVATLAAGDRLPAITALRELQRRSRATSAPSQQLFKTMLGLEVSPKLSREASAFWNHVRTAKDIAARDNIWSGILPSATELLAPDLFLASTQIPDDLSGLI